MSPLLGQRSPYHAYETAPSSIGTTTGWLDSRSSVWSWCVIALAFALRLRSAIGTHLNPDEALHFLLTNQHTLGEAYRAGLTNAHPPLFFIALYFWRWLGTSELTLRLLPVLAGTASVWIASRWAAAVFGRTTGLATLLILSFAPFLISLQAELRQYSLLLLFLSAGLWSIERLFRAPSPAAVAPLALFLALAALTHYSAAWAIAALAAYVTLRWNDLPRSTALAWAASQAGIAALYGMLYVTHLSKLRGGQMEAEAADGWLRSFYFRSSSQDVILFVLSRTVSVFDTLFSHRGVGYFVLLLFLTGVFRIFAARIRGSKPDLSPALGVLLLLPFALNAIGALMRLYPYGGSRHSVFLILFATAGASFAIAGLVRERAAVLLAAATVVVPLWHLHAVLAPQEVPRSQRDKAQMTDAIDYVRASAPVGSVIVTDYQSSLLLTYYLGGPDVAPPSTTCGGLVEKPIGGYRVTTWQRWSATGEDLRQVVDQWQPRCGSPGSVWVFDAGWGENLLDDLLRSAPGSLRNERRFGSAISFFQFDPGSNGVKRGGEASASNSQTVRRL